MGVFLYYGLSVDARMIAEGVAVETTNLRTIVAGASSLVKRVSAELGIAEMIDARVEWDPKQCKLSPGTRIEALVVNTLVHRKPLYKVEGFYAEQDVELLFGAGVTASDFNDDALARALDALAQAEPRELFNQIALGAIVREGSETRCLHGDTTSISVYGEYTQAGEHLKLVHGYSKDHRPDLKQFMYGLIVNAEGLPVMGEACDGNTNDNAWNQRVLSEFDRMLSERGAEGLIYVADASLPSEENLKRAAERKVRIITRLPATFGLEQQVKQAAFASDGWQEVGSLSERAGAERYRVWETEGELYGRTYRLIVVRSLALDRRAQRTIHRRVEQEAKELNKAAGKLQKERYECEADAMAARERWLEQHGGALHRLWAEVSAETVLKRPRGRPSKAAVVAEQTRYRITVHIEPPSEELLREQREQFGAWVLLTDVPREEWSSVEVLRTYKRQVVVEQPFAFLKSPMMIDGIYLKRPDRAFALAYVFLMALLIASVLVRRIRRALEAASDTITLAGKRVTQRPTMVGILELFHSLQVILIDTGQGVMRLLPQNTDPQTLKVLHLAGYSEAIYTQQATL